MEKSKLTWYCITEVKLSYNELFSKHLRVSSCNLITGHDMKNEPLNIKLSKDLGLEIGTVSHSSSISY